MLKKLGRKQGIKHQPEASEAPPGQYVTGKFPVLSFGPTPEVNLDTWRFRVFGLVETEVILDWGQFIALDKIVVSAAFHCVTQWSRLENTWEGVPVTALTNLSKIRPDARYVLVHCIGGYTTNLPVKVLIDNDVLFAYKHDGSPLSPEHGGPLRLVVPKRYGWKSAKWVNGLEFVEEDVPGFWESNGYHMNGDPWKEERFVDKQI